MGRGISVMLYSFVGREPGEEEVGRVLIIGELIKKAWDEDRGARHRTPWGHLLINTVWCPGRRTEHKHSASDLSKRKQAESISLGTLCWAFKFVGHTVLKLYPKPRPQYDSSHGPSWQRVSPSQQGGLELLQVLCMSCHWKQCLPIWDTGEKPLSHKQKPAWL